MAGPRREPGDHWGDAERHLRQRSWDAAFLAAGIGVGAALYLPAVFLGLLMQGDCATEACSVNQAADQATSGWQIAVLLLLALVVPVLSWLTLRRWRLAAANLAVSLLVLLLGCTAAFSSVLVVPAQLTGRWAYVLLIPSAIFLAIGSAMVVLSRTTRERSSEPVGPTELDP